MSSPWRKAIKADVERARRKMDRFNGEFSDPPIWKHCDNCKKPIHKGDKYIDNYAEGKYCMACGEVFEVDGDIKEAGGEDI